MKKIYLLIAMSLLLALLVACAPLDFKQEGAAETEEVSEEAPKEAAKETVDEKVVEPKKEEIEIEPLKKEETAPAPEPKKEETKTAPKELPAELKSLLERADQKLTSMSYLYASPETSGRFLDTYHVRGDKIKVKLYEENYYMHKDYYDTVYLDTTKKTATARCESPRRCVFPDFDNTGRVFDDVEYDEYRRKTPYEWLADITTPELLGPEVVDKRSALKIQYPKDDSRVEMWLDNSYGIPLQFKIIHPDDKEESYQFSNFQFNTLKEEDVVPAFTEEQPTE